MPTFKQVKTISTGPKILADKHRGFWLEKDREIVRETYEFLLDDAEVDAVLLGQVNAAGQSVAAHIAFSKYG